MNTQACSKFFFGFVFVYSIHMADIHLNCCMHNTNKNVCRQRDEGRSFNYYYLTTTTAKNETKENRNVLIQSFQMK